MSRTEGNKWATIKKSAGIFIPAASLVGAIVVGASMDSQNPNPEPESTPTPTEELDSRNPEDYGYKVIFDIGGDDEFNIFTDNMPELTIADGMNLVKATDVFCPADQNRTSIAGTKNIDLSAFGCDKEFVSEYEFANPNRTIVVSNQLSTPEA